MMLCMVCSVLLLKKSNAFLNEHFFIEVEDDVTDVSLIGYYVVCLHVLPSCVLRKVFLIFDILSFFSAGRK